MIFDTHAHYDDAVFDEDREEIIKKIREENVGAVMCVGASIESSAAAVKIAESHENMFAAVGVHPDEVGGLEERGIEAISSLLTSNKVRSIGEIGLDYFEHEKGERTEEVKALQRKWFDEQLKLAVKEGLPIIVHSRDAAKDTWDILEARHFPRGVIHCYSYSPEMAVEYVKKGYYLGFGGAITFKNAKKNVESVAAVGIDHILLETDCPYMAPVPVRGTRNYSGNLKYVVEKLSEILSISVEEVEAKTYENALKLFGNM